MIVADRRESANPRGSLDGNAAGSFALTASGVSKAFGATKALSDVSLTVRVGEIRALLGENGAGKSTLIKILTGLVDSDSGVLSTAGGSSSGVVAVHQELTLVPTLSVAENLALRKLPRRGIFIDKGAMRSRAVVALQRVELDVDPSLPLERLGLAERQLVEIARALQEQPSVLLLDEPTSSLNSSEARMLFRFVRDLAASGTAVLFVSHRLDEVYDLCQSATVLRDGRVIGDVALADTNPEALTRMMLGDRLLQETLEPPVAAGQHVRAGEPVLRCQALSGEGFTGVSIDVWPGEVVGVAGLVGAGQSAFARALGGLQRTYVGDLHIGNAAVRSNSPARSIAAGIAYVPSDRALEGLCLDLSTGTNAILPSLQSTSRLGLVERSKTRHWAEAIVREFDVRPPEPSKRVGDLSGGNQQKVVLGKWMATQPTVTVLDDPTRGVDVGAKLAIHEAIRSRAGQGGAVVLVSSDVTELLSLADRIVIFRGGTISGGLTRDTWSHEHLLAALSQGDPADD